jgi:hypothetical protein
MKNSPMKDIVLLGSILGSSIPRKNEKTNHYLFKSL